MRLEENSIAFAIGAESLEPGRVALSFSGAENVVLIDLDQNAGFEG